MKKHLESEEDISDLPLESQPLNKAFSIGGDRDHIGKVLAEEIGTDANKVVQ
ncbi:MAG: hypothetical protein WA885_11660 [Phormidesmis sp.]